MAFMSQENKKSLAPAIKAVLKKYGLKGSISVRHHSTLVVTIREGKIDFFAGKDAEYRRINHYHIDSNYEGEAAACLTELSEAMHGPDWYDESDAMTDYFNIAYYVEINVGRWDKPYKLSA